MSVSRNDESGISHFFSCGLCFVEIRDIDTSARDYSQLDVGVSDDGDLIVWCRRHSAPVALLGIDVVRRKLIAIAKSGCSNPHHRTTH